jgi:GNAT superfamily N-acetyltransferase
VIDPEFKLINKHDIEDILPLLEECDPSISIAVLKARLSEMVDIGYECVGIYDKNKLIGLCGIWTLVKYYIVKHLEPDNVYIKAEYRNAGIGKKLDTWLQTLALSRGCRAIELNCYIENESGKHYWESLGYQAIGVHYQKKLVDTP